jgi:hypothetical protein
MGGKLGLPGRRRPMKGVLLPPRARGGAQSNRAAWIILSAVDCLASMVFTMRHVKVLKKL